MLRKLHRRNAQILGIFILAHLINHLTLLDGVETHIAVMEFLRSFYRPILVEAGMLFLFICQVALGILMMFKHRRPQNFWTWVQYGSGTVFGLFLMQHMTASIVTRIFNPELDTNVYWAASVVSQTPQVWYFAPYYSLGILSLFVHIGAFLKKRPKWKAYSPWVIATGLIVAIVIVSRLMGWPKSIHLPSEYISYIN